MTFVQQLLTEAARLDGDLLSTRRQIDALTERMRDLSAKRQTLSPLLEAYKAYDEPVVPPPAEEVERAEIPASRRRAWTKNPYFSAERDDYIRLRYPEGDTIEAITDALNRMEGVRLEVRKVRERASNLGCRRGEIASVRRKQHNMGPVRRGKQAGKHARFANKDWHHADRAAASLDAYHPAVVEARTMFPTSVHAAGDVPRVLISGKSSAKVGDRVQKGPWAGMAAYTLTLEERASCPTSCGLWRECYGNAMPFARRIKHDENLLIALRSEVIQKAVEHKRGFVIRLHVLGDFFHADYVHFWNALLRSVPQLHAFGYTAHAIDSEIGKALDVLNRRYPDRWVIRSSVAPTAALAGRQATTIWRQPEGRVVPEGIVCPAMNGGTEACVTCGLCWHPAAADKRIVFVGHGLNRTGRRPLAQPIEQEAA